MVFPSIVDDDCDDAILVDPLDDELASMNSKSPPTPLIGERFLLYTYLYGLQWGAGVVFIRICVYINIYTSVGIYVILCCSIIVRSKVQHGYQQQSRELGRFSSSSSSLFPFGRFIYIHICCVLSRSSTHFKSRLLSLHSADVSKSSEISCDEKTK